MVRVLPRSGKSKSRLRSLERIFEHINEPAAARYLGLDDDLRRGRPAVALLPTPSSICWPRRPPFCPIRSPADPAAFLLSKPCAHGRPPRPGDTCHGGGYPDLFAGRSFGQGRPGEHGAQPRMPGAIPGPPRCRAGRGHAPGPQDPASPRPIQGRAQAGLRRASAQADQDPAARWDSAFLSAAGFRPSSSTSSRPSCSIDPVSTADCSARRACRTLVAEHVEGRREHGHRLWALVMLELWFRNYLDSASASHDEMTFDA